MSALLALYGAQFLFRPGHVERIWGFAGFRHLLEAVFGPLSVAGMSGAIAGLYGALVYLTPLFGSFVADRLIGRTRAVILGGSAMAVGHFCMAFDQTYLVALACILIGVGFFKGNLSAQVGELYAAGDPRRADAFQIYTLAIQVAVIVAPLVCGFLGQKIAWGYGFGAAGVGMVIGLAVYVAGRRWLPPEPVRHRGKGPTRAALTPVERRRVALLLFLVPVLALAFVGNQEIFAAYELWGDAHYRLLLFGWAMPASFLISLDAIVSTLALVAVLLFWRRWSRRRSEPDELTKVTIGVFIAMLAPLALVVASLHEAATHEKIGLGWALAFHLLNDVGFVIVYPVGLALYSRAAPKALASTMMAVFLLILFAAGLIVSKLASLLDVLPGTTFWALHAALIGGAGVVLLIVRRAAGRLLRADDAH